MWPLPCKRSRLLFLLAHDPVPRESVRTPLTGRVLIAAAVRHLRRERQRIYGQVLLPVHVHAVHSLGRRLLQDQLRNMCPMVYRATR